MTAAVNMGLYLHSPRGNKAQIRAREMPRNMATHSLQGRVQTDSCSHGGGGGGGGAEITPTTSSNK